MPPHLQGDGVGTRAMTNETLQKTALRVLRNQGIGNINFVLNGLIVAQHRYGLVEYLIGTGKIACEAVAKMPVPPGQQLPKGYTIGALYNPDANTIFFPRADYGTSNAFERSVILHEATHAAFDAVAKSDDDRVLQIDDESAAVLAQ